MPPELEGAPEFQNAVALAEMNHQLDYFVNLASETTKEQTCCVLRGEGTSRDAALCSGLEASEIKRLKSAGRRASNFNDRLHLALCGLMTEVQCRVPLGRRFGALLEPQEGRIPPAAACAWHVGM